MNWLRKHISTILLTAALLVGLCLLVYPTFSDWWNSFHQSRAIATYAENVAQIDNSHYADILADAHAYNSRLAQLPARNWNQEPEELAEYARTMDVTGTGIMCYIEIPKIKCSLPIYHGVEDTVLQIAVGHIPGSSLPIGGESTHAVLSGHRGLPSARLFTDLDKLVVGDVFLIHVLDETLTYEVDNILIVEPYDLSALELSPGEDLVTLVTCTPYGVNSHRLLVRGHRIETAAQTRTVRVPADAVQIDPTVVAPVVAAPMLVLLFLIALIPSGKKKPRSR